MYDQMHSFNTNKGFNVADWRCTFNTIPEKYWVGVEMFVKGEWVRWDEKISIEEGAQSKNNILKSYDLFLNNRYQVDVNEKSLERVKNYFK